MTVTCTSILVSCGSSLIFSSTSKFFNNILLLTFSVFSIEILFFTFKSLFILTSVNLAVLGVVKPIVEEFIVDSTIFCDPVCCVLVPVIVPFTFKFPLI